MRSRASGVACLDASFCCFYHTRFCPLGASALSQKFWVLSWNGPSSFDKLAIGDGSLDFWVDQGCKAAGNQGGIAVEA